MIAAKMVAKNIQKVSKRLTAYDKKRTKAGKDATKGAAFKMRDKLIDEITAGSPGGKAFSPLSEIAKRTGKPLNRTPLKKAAKAIRYQADFGKDKYIFRVGFVGKLVSKWWKRKAELHQTGGTVPVTAEKRRALAAIGGRMKGRWRKGKGRSGAFEHVQGKSAKFFFLKPSTTHFKIKRRPIIEPFWSAHENEAWRLIESNFKKKMAGEEFD